MVKFIYKRGGDHNYKSPFTGIEHIFVGQNPTEIKDNRDIELIRKSGGFTEVGIVTKKVIVTPVKILEKIKIEVIPEVTKIEESHSFKKSNRKSKR